MCVPKIGSAWLQFCVLQGFVGANWVLDSPNQEIIWDYGFEAIPASLSRVSVSGYLFPYLLMIESAFLRIGSVWVVEGALGDHLTSMNIRGHNDSSNFKNLGQG